MTGERFFAAAKYDDFKGTVAADSADTGGPQEWLKGRGHFSEGDYLVGVSLWAGEYFGEFEDPVAVEFLVGRGGYENVEAEFRAGREPELRCINVDVPIAEFLGWFKRFSLTLSRRGLLEGGTFHRSESSRP